jgi:hypothetical protein
MSEGSPKRWVWDLFPLAKDSWGAWELEPEMPRPDHRIYMYRYQGDGYLGPVMNLERLNRTYPNAQILHREAYAPTEEDFSLLKRCYPQADSCRPDWHKVKADLFVAGLDPDKLDKAEAPVLLGWLGKAKAAPAANSRKRIGF